MLSRVEITGYRGFKSYRMDGLTRVNLLVGRNNCGKTSLLEGLQFLATSGDPAVLEEVARRRGEVQMHTSPTGGGMQILTEISHFFHGHTLSTDVEFRIAGNNGYTPVTAKIVLEKKSGDSDTSAPRRPRRGPGPYLKIFGGHRNGQDDAGGFRVTSSGGVDFDESEARYRRVTARRSEGPQTRFVGPDSLSTNQLAGMWDEITLAGQEADVAGAIKILDDRVIDIHFLTGMLASGYYPGRAGIVVGMQEQKGRIPLGSMGDGVRRLMALAASQAFTKGGCLLVDEIDTGLHYTAMHDMWKLIVAKAAAANSQVFATTHSWDCIAGLSELCNRSPELKYLVSIHKIDAAIPHSIPFQGESVARMEKSHIDPR